MHCQHPVMQLCWQSHRRLRLRCEVWDLTNASIAFQCAMLTNMCVNLRHHAQHSLRTLEYEPRWLQAGEYSPGGSFATNGEDDGSAARPNYRRTTSAISGGGTARVVCAALRNGA